MDNSVSQKTIAKHLLPLRIRLKEFRKRIEIKRKKNPRLFDGSAKFLQVVWFLLSTFWPTVIDNMWVAGIFTCVTSGALYLSQWVLLTNKRERTVRNIQEEFELEQEKMKEEHEKVLKEEKIKVVKTVNFSHTVAHGIKMSISRMPNQDIAVTRNEVVDFLNRALNSLEQNLSMFYEHDICASIKLCSRPNTLKTFVRGEKNIKCRGGEKKVKRLNRKSIKVSDNYAYNLIIKEGLRSFSEGDLRSLHGTENGKEKFCCEYGEGWQGLFLSTIIIPIRSLELSGDKEEYKMLGLVCIDSKEIHPEWNDCRENYAYKITAFIADAIYSLLEQYISIQHKNRKCEQ